MKLNVLERLKVIELFPSTGHYRDLVEFQKGQEVCRLNDEDLKAIDYNMQTAKFNQIKALQHVVDIPMSEWVTNFLRSVIAKKESDGKLDGTEMSLYEKFVITYEA